MLEPLLEKNTVGCAVINHWRNNVAATFGGNHIRSLKPLTAYLPYYLLAFWRIGVFTIHKSIYDAFVNVIMTIFRQRIYKIVENFSFLSRVCVREFGAQAFEPDFSSIEEDATTHTGRSKLGRLPARAAKASAFATRERPTKSDGKSAERMRVITRVHTL